MGVPDRGDAASEGGWLDADACFRGQKRGHGLGGGGKRGHVLALAPSLEKPKVSPVGLPRTDGLLGLCQIDGGGQIRTERGGEVGGFSNGQCG